MILIKESYLYIPHPRTWDLGPSLAKHFEGYVRNVLPPDDDAIVKLTSIRNPFAVVREWFDLNPDWQKDGFLRFINYYEHSHFLRPSADSDQLTLFWNDVNDITIIRDEDVEEGLERVFEENIDLIEIEKYPDYRPNYGPDEVEALKSRFAYDLDKYEYSF